MKNVKCLALLILTCLSLVGCGTKVGTGAVDLQFTNNTAAILNAEFKSLGVLGFTDEMELDALLGVTPTIYQIKLVAFYLSEDIDANGNNIGGATRIWTSSKCDADLTYCGINPTYSGSYVVDYFDLAQGSAAVNAAFRNYTRDTQESQLSAGTYRYIRMDFTGKQYDGDTTPFLKFGTSTAHEVRAQNYALTVQLDTPLVLGEGESFTVDLAYDLQNRYYASSAHQPPPAEVGSQKWTCTGTGTVPCIVEAEFTPTITKN